MQEKYAEYTRGNEFITIPEALNAVHTRTISLLTTNVKSRKLIGVIRESIEKALKSHKILARGSNALWDILLATEQEAKQVAGYILETKSVPLQTEYMGARKTKVTVHRVPVDISEDRMGAFFAR